VLVTLLAKDREDRKLEQEVMGLINKREKNVCSHSLIWRAC
jgi:hypothetical protein